MLLGEYCKTCAFFESRAAGPLNYGVCRLNPGPHPEVNTDDCCGQHPVVQMKTGAMATRMFERVNAWMLETATWAAATGGAETMERIAEAVTAAPVFPCDACRGAGTLVATLPYGGTVEVGCTVCDGECFVQLGDEVDASFDGGASDA